MRKAMTSKKGAQEEMKQNDKFDQARSKKRSVELKKLLFCFFSALKSPREPPQGVWFRGGGLRLGVCKY